MALSSPGVEVKVIDESFYTPAEPGTVPLIIVASAENKSNGGGTGTAPGTLKANAGEVYLLTSQKDLADTFGDPVFKTDANNNPIHAGEQNEYGLQAAYSLLGVSNRAFVVRADVDLNQLDASADAPTGEPSNGTYWFDTANTAFGIFEWDGTAKSTSSPASAQTFTNKTPIVITDTTKVSSGIPKTSVGAIGDYAIVTTSTANEMFYKNRDGAWVKVGSNDWTASWPTVLGGAVGTIVDATTLLLNGNTVTIDGTTISAVADSINDAAISGVSAGVRNNVLEIYSDGTVNSIVVAAGTATLSALGLTAGTYYMPKLTIDKHTQVPAYKTRDTQPRPTGSVWIKTTEPNSGARWRVKRYNSTTQLWEAVEAPIYATNQSALYNLDRTGGGANLAVGTLFTKSNVTENSGVDTFPTVADFTIFRRSAVGATTITSAKITASSLAAGTYTFNLAESDAGSESLESVITVSFTATGATTDADVVAGAINSAGFQNVTAEVDSQNRVVISHAQGGEMLITDTDGGLSDIGFATSGSAATTNLVDAAAGTGADFLATLWEELSYTAGADAPSSLTEDGTLWYSSVVDEIDIMIHNGSTWVGYKDSTSPFYDTGDDATDPAGPIVSATEPETQSDDSPLANGDLWIDTNDIENFPTIYKYNKDLQRWVLVDKTDQSTEDGVLFADARYNTAGANSDEAGSIEDLLTNNFLDFDAPDPALYPKGMLLWNLRRSGFNVKKFVQNYVDVAGDNERFNNSESMDSYYPHRWVTESGNQEDGSGTFGRKAQRKVIVQALQATVNSNQQIRDEESRVFNLIACPGYPELIGELVSLNYDRGLTAFVVGDTPARLTSDATTLLNWGTNQDLAVEDNDVGLVSSDEYLGVFYPWGYTSDNFGNNVVVPPSHMILRTIALNDQVAYPWFAPAGVRRGGITNATAVGYVDSQEGEFKSVALNVGQRDTLASIKVNPITFITGTGLVNYGQYTRARAASALDRINVARLVVYLRRQLSALAKPYIFEPNDKITRDEIKAAVESLLLELVGQRALYDYLVVCDESNNTPSRIDRNELYIDIAIEPVKAVEFIYIPLRLKNTGEISGL
jgi:hypothetical protein